MLHLIASVWSFSLIQPNIATVQTIPTAVYKLPMFSHVSSHCSMHRNPNQSLVIACHFLSGKWEVSSKNLSIAGGCLQVQSRSDWDEHHHLQWPVRCLHGLRGRGGEHHLRVPDWTQDSGHQGRWDYWRGQEPPLDPHLCADFTWNFPHLFKNVHEN